MKAFIIALSILIAIGILISVHSAVMLNLADGINQKCILASEYAEAENWDSAISELRSIEEIWEKHRIWAALTLSAKDTEQIEISLEQSLIYAKLHQKPDFLGEFKRFTMLIEHIPRQEGFHIAEIL